MSDDYPDVILDKPEDFYYIYIHPTKGYSIEYLDKFKSYDAAFLAAEDALADRGSEVLLYFNKEVGIEMFEEFIAFMKRKKTHGSL